MSGKRLPPGAAREIVAMVREGLPYAEIAEAFGVSPSSVTYHAVRAGVSRRGAPAAAAPRPPSPRPRRQMLFADLQPWADEALCAEVDPELFFPELGESTRPAKSICGSCQVRVDCLRYALDHDEQFGIYGGLSPRERRKLKKGSA